MIRHHCRTGSTHNPGHLPPLRFVRLSSAARRPLCLRYRRDPHGPVHFGETFQRKGQRQLVMRRQPRHAEGHDLAGLERRDGRRHEPASFALAAVTAGLPEELDRPFIPHVQLHVRRDGRHFRRLSPADQPTHTVSVSPPARWNSPPCESSPSSPDCTTAHESRMRSRSLASSAGVMAAAPPSAALTPRPAGRPRP